MKTVVSYTLYSKSKFFYPFHWFFTKVFGKGQMKIGLQKMKKYVMSSTVFLYD